MIQVDKIEYIDDRWGDYKGIDHKITRGTLPFKCEYFLYNRYISAR